MSQSSQMLCAFRWHKRWCANKCCLAEMASWKHGAIQHSTNKRLKMKSCQAIECLAMFIGFSPIWHGCVKSQTIIEHSTFSTTFVADAAKRLAQKGIRYLVRNIDHFCLLLLQ